MHKPMVKPVVFKISDAPEIRRRMDKSGSSDRRTDLCRGLQQIRGPIIGTIFENGPPATDEMNKGWCGRRDSNPSSNLGKVK